MFGEGRATGAIHYLCGGLSATNDPYNPSCGEGGSRIRTDPSVISKPLVRGALCQELGPGARPPAARSLPLPGELTNEFTRQEVDVLSAMLNRISAPLNLEQPEVGAASRSRFETFTFQIRFHLTPTS